MFSKFLRQEFKQMSKSVVNKPTQLGMLRGLHTNRAHQNKVTVVGAAGMVYMYSIILTLPVY